MSFFHCLKELMNNYETTIESLEFPCEVKKTKNESEYRKLRSRIY